MTDSPMRRETAPVTGWAGGLIGFGTVTTIIGVIVLVWPDATLNVIAVTFGVFAVLAGLFHLGAALAPGHQDGRRRLLLALFGVISLISGIVFLRHLAGTLTLLILLLGLFWVVDGVLGTIRALTSPERPGRGWSITVGMLSAAAGIVLLVWPAPSLRVLVWVLGLELVVVGVVTFGAGIHLRRRAAAPARAAFT
ncbi:HdeD family acid-resistance protein [Amycolatopsis sp. GM8]|uniref:HdeD family acid-resistance protein n=1 Tax=Amycolatopsis sp. GM8 TaxID=2896530 RepID=UPI001F226318|nr:DUF308 domain-containing protein [Amycolatopsis sp. GM8]